MNVCEVPPLRRDVALHGGLLDFYLAYLVVVLVYLLLLPVDLHERLATLGLGVLDAPLGGLDGVFQPTDLAFDLLDLAFDAELFVLAFPLYLPVEVVELVFESGDSTLSLVEFGLRLGQFVLLRVDLSRDAIERGPLVLQFGGLQVALVLLFLLAERLVLQCSFAFVRQLVESVLLLLDSEVRLADALFHRLQFLEGVLLLRVELRHAGYLVDDAPPLVGGHVDYLGHVALHDDVVPLGRDAGLCQQVLDVGEVRRAPVEVVVGVVVVLGLLHPALDADLVDAADVLAAGRRDHLRPVESPVLVV